MWPGHGTGSYFASWWLPELVASDPGCSGSWSSCCMASEWWGPLCYAAQRITPKAQSRGAGSSTWRLVLLQTMPEFSHGFILKMDDHVFNFLFWFVFIIFNKGQWIAGASATNNQYQLLLCKRLGTHICCANAQTKSPLCREYLALS